MVLGGKVCQFEAFGMEYITGALSVLRREIIQELITRLDNKTIQSLLRTIDVDLLIEAKHLIMASRQR